MEQIISYASLFVVFVVYVLDTLSGWLTAHKVFSGIIGFGILAVLVIKRKPLAPRKEISVWSMWLFIFVGFVYFLGKLFEAKGSAFFGYAAGLALLGFMLILGTLGVLAITFEAVENYCLKKRWIRDLLDKVFGKQEMD